MLTRENVAGCDTKPGVIIHYRGIPLPQRSVIPVVVAAMAVVKVPFVMGFLVACLCVPLWTIEN